MEFKEKVYLYLFFPVVIASLLILSLYYVNIQSFIKMYEENIAINSFKLTDQQLILDAFAKSIITNYDFMLSFNDMHRTKRFAKRVFRENFSFLPSLEIELVNFNNEIDLKTYESNIMSIPFNQKIYMHWTHPSQKDRSQLNQSEKWFLNYGKYQYMIYQLTQLFYQQRNPRSLPDQQFWNMIDSSSGIILSFPADNQYQDKISGFKKQRTYNIDDCIYKSEYDARCEDRFIRTKIADQIIFIEPINQQNTQGALFVQTCTPIQKIDKIYDVNRYFVACQGQNQNSIVDQFNLNPQIPVSYHLVYSQSRIIAASSDRIFLNKTQTPKKIEDYYFNTTLARASPQYQEFINKTSFLDRNWNLSKYSGQCNIDDDQYFSQKLNFSTVDKNYLSIFSYVSLCQTDENNQRGFISFSFLCSSIDVADINSYIVDHSQKVVLINQLNGIIVLFLISFIALITIYNSFNVTDAVIQPIYHLSETMMKLNAVDSDLALRLLNSHNLQMAFEGRVLYSTFFKLISQVQSANQLYIDGQTDEALTKYENARKMYKSIGNQIGQGICSNNIGIIKLYDLDIQSAIDNFENALTIAEQERDSLLEMYISQGVTVTELMVDEQFRCISSLLVTRSFMLSETLIRFQENVEFVNDQPVDKDAYNIIISMIQRSLKVDRVSESMGNFNHTLVYSNYRLSYLYFQLGKTQKSIYYLDEAETLFETHNQYFNKVLFLFPKQIIKAKITNQRAQILIKSGQYSTAADLLTKMFEKDWCYDPEERKCSLTLLQEIFTINKLNTSDISNIEKLSEIQKKQVTIFIDKTLRRGDLGIAHYLTNQFIYRFCEDDDIIRIVTFDKNQQKDFLKSKKVLLQKYISMDDLLDENEMEFVEDDTNQLESQSNQPNLLQVLFSDLNDQLNQELVQFVRKTRDSKNEGLNSPKSAQSFSSSSSQQEDEEKENNEYREEEVDNRDPIRRNNSSFQQTLSELKRGLSKDKIAEFRQSRKISQGKNQNQAIVFVVFTNSNEIDFQKSNLNIDVPLDFIQKEMSEQNITTFCFDYAIENQNFSRNCTGVSETTAINSRLTNYTLFHNQELETHTREPRTSKRLLTEIQEEEEVQQDQDRTFRQNSSIMFQENPNTDFQSLLDEIANFHFIDPINMIPQDIQHLIPIVKEVELMKPCFMEIFD